MLEKISSDLKEAMKNHDKLRTDVLKMLKGAIQLEQINKKIELKDEDIYSIVSKQIKMRNDSIEQFEKAQRDELVDTTKKEIEILNGYLPKQLTNEELNEIIDEVIERVNPTNKSDFGKIMKEITPLVKGKAELSVVSQIIKEKLSF